MRIGTSRLLLASLLALTFTACKAGPCDYPSDALQHKGCGEVADAPAEPPPPPVDAPVDVPPDSRDTTCIVDATLTDPILIVDLGASVGDCTVLALDPTVPPTVIGTPKHASTKQVALTLPSGSGSRPLLAVVVATSGMTCQAPVVVNQ